MNRENLLMENAMMIMMTYTEMLYHEVLEIETDIMCLMDTFKKWSREFEDGYNNDGSCEYLDEITEFARVKIKTYLSSYEAWMNA